MKIKILLLTALIGSLTSCNDEEATSSSTGISKADANIKAGSDGLTVEQRNIKKRLEVDNKPGSIKHLYVVSAMSGDVIIYSTVSGKVTSGGKRLTNTKEITSAGKYDAHTNVVMPAMQDDGTYGSSMNYLYWFDSKGIYHQHYVTGGQIVHISSQPLAVKSVIINMETTQR